MSTGSVAFGDCRYKVSNLSAAKAFYSGAFGVQPYFDEPTWVVFQIRDHQLWLEADSSGEESVYEVTHSFYGLTKHRTLIFWAVNDVNAICSRFRELGGSIFKAPKQDGPFMSAIVIDPWNNKVGLHSILF